LKTQRTKKKAKLHLRREGLSRGGKNFFPWASGILSRRGRGKLRCGRGYKTARGGRIPVRSTQTYAPRKKGERIAPQRKVEER